MSDGAKGGTRTLKELAPLAPKASASTNSATFALIRSTTAVELSNYSALPESLPAA